MKEPQDAEKMLDLRLFSYDGEQCNYGFQSAELEEFSGLELAFCAAMFERIGKQLSDKLVERFGEERAYMLTEFQKISINNIHAGRAELQDKLAQVNAAADAMIPEGALPRLNADLDETIAEFKLYNVEFSEDPAEREDDGDVA